MKNKATEGREKSLPRRIFAGALGLLLVLALLTGVSFVTGNPLAEALARRRAANYLSTTYPGRELDVYKRQGLAALVAIPMLFERERPEQPGRPDGE